MKTSKWFRAKTTSALVGACLLIAPGVEALPNSETKKAASLDGLLNSGSANPGDINQVTSVSELSDVEPTAWAYEALRSLVERYGCIVGYPDRTFRGDRALSRWEFAAGLNACMNVIERLIQENVAVLREDIDKLKRLAEEFESELAALGTRVDNLETRVSFLEDHQFSTTTKLTGEVIFAVSGVANGERFGGEDIPKNTTLSNRTRLELNTSFTGDDLLYTRLATGNTADFAEVTGTFEGTLAFTQPDNNELAVEVLFYNFPVTENISVWIEAAGGAFDDFTNTLNFLDGDGASGAISAFGTRAPIYYLGDGSGLGVQAQFGAFQLSAGYLASDASDPSEGAGLFNGAYGIIAQVGYVPDENFGIALTYSNGYGSTATSVRDPGVGTNFANFGSFTEAIFGEAVPTVDNSYGIEFSWRVFDGFVLGGWGGYTNSVTLNTLDGQINRGDLDVWNWAVTFAFPDAFKEGNTAGIIFGMEPWVSNSNIFLPGDIRVRNDDTSFHIEAFYEYAVNDNIAITPGIIIITSPDYNNDNSTLVIGTIRTTFTF